MPKVPTTKLATNKYATEQDIKSAGPHASRRQVLRYSLTTIAGLISSQMIGCVNPNQGGGNNGGGNTGGGTTVGTGGVANPPEPLLAPDENGIMLMPGFSSRIIARSGQIVENSNYAWHAAPDGGATFATSDGGWIYVSNSEVSNGGGGVGAIRFDADGNIVDAYSILDNTSRNCAGGVTPWDTWLSCEEVSNGLVYECDPLGDAPPIARPALGRFNHEAAAVDDVHQHVFLTEDRSDGLLYRFSPDVYPDLSAGTLEAAQLIDIGGSEYNVVWHEVPNPSGSGTPTRDQVSSATTFNGGEGIIYDDGTIFFVTKGDNRVWAYDTNLETMSVIYHAGSSSNPILTGVDNITTTPVGHVLVAEDGGNMQVVGITDAGLIYPFLQVVGHSSSEITGISYNPNARRFYFSSQRGSAGRSSAGITYEITVPE